MSHGRRRDPERHWDRRPSTPRGGRLSSNERRQSMARESHELSDATLRLILAPGLGPITLKKLEQQFGSHDLAATATVRELMQLEGIGHTTANSIRRAIDQVQPQQEREEMAKTNVRLILLGDDDYPVLLSAIPGPPMALWIRGELKDADRLAVGVVGSRCCTAYGREQAGRFASLLAQCGLTIISGGALGIDGEAHRGALRVDGRTIAVMGCGLARTYPPQHAELFDRIVSQGGVLLSEYPMQTEPKGDHFPHRNRIISGLSLGVLVIEAAKRSGALITARKAAEDQGREAMALPGRIDSPASAGCLRAIQEGWAALVTTHADVLNQLDASSHLVRGALEAAGHTSATTRATLFDTSLTTGQKSIVDALREADGNMIVEHLAAKTQLPLSQVQADLTLLQIRGNVHRDHQGVHLKR